MDDLDKAEGLLIDGEPALAIAHIRLWYAKQNREYQRAQEDIRAKQATLFNPPAMPFPGAF